jgi:hypothetical protein
VSGELTLSGSPTSCRTAADELRTLSAASHRAARTIRASGSEHNLGWAANAIEQRLSIADAYAVDLADDAEALAGGLVELALDLDDVGTVLARARDRLEPLGLVDGDNVISPSARPILRAMHPGVDVDWGVAMADLHEARRREASAQARWLHTLGQHTEHDNIASGPAVPALPVVLPPADVHLTPHRHGPALGAISPEAAIGHQSGVLSAIGYDQPDSGGEIPPEEGLTCGPR